MTANASLWHQWFCGGVRGIRRLALAGVNDLHEPADLLAADSDALHRLTTVLVDRREPVVIERMLADSPTLAALTDSARGRAILVRRAAPIVLIFHSMRAGSSLNRISTPDAAPTCGVRAARPNKQDRFVSRF